MPTALRVHRGSFADAGFKARAVAEALEQGAGVSAIAHRLGIHRRSSLGGVVWS
ncbi:transposase [Sinorhizobium meliloti]|nr:transposase [Sinorhizobium meliloti]